MNTQAPVPFAAKLLNKSFGAHVALDGVSLEVPEGRVIGLLGRNGAGKTTLLNLAAGLYLPSSGECRTFGVPSGSLESAQLQRLGLVQQEGSFLEWMTVRQHLDFNASFYPRWDRGLERRLLNELELDPKRKIIQLSPGDRQKLSILLGVCHHPSLLLLDEPMSSLDPIVRARMLDFLLELLRDENCTVVISSHILNDVEKIVDWVVCMEAGRIVENAAFDELQETYAEWSVEAQHGALPDRYPETFVLNQRGNERQALLQVKSRDQKSIGVFAERYRAEVRTRPLNLSEMFPLIVGKGGPKS